MATPPVLFLIFNRPDFTRRTFAAIRKARPTRLLIHADGPRADRNETAACEEARRVTEEIDWPCEVRRIYRETNLGCGRAVSAALDSFFEWIEEGVVIEDDCAPVPLFFEYCAAMLERFRHDERVMHVSGTGLDFAGGGGPRIALVSFPFIWGWATWRRAWRQYRFSLPDASEREALVAQHNRTTAERRYWHEQLAATASGRIDTWDYQWVVTLWRMRGLAVTPNFSLVENIGGGEAATHVTTHTMGFAPLASFATLPVLPEVPSPDVKSAMAAINTRCLGLDLRLSARLEAHLFRHHPRLSWLFLALRRRVVGLRRP